ncbi:uncharacterized protein [Diadema setosum]|uniref:uncharacterized protein n=1 Tax=Diadema setosum TaxID=31175 RepID=UPI003B3B0EE0
MGRFTWSNTVIYTLHLIGIISKVTSAAGTYELRLNSFSNDRAVDFSGQCCGNTTSSGSTYQCVGPCRTFFSLCLLQFLRDIPDELPPGQCTLSNFDYEFTSILGENSFDVPNGLISVSFDIDWPGDFSLALDVWHSDSDVGLPDDENRRLLARLRTHRSLNVSTVWSNFTYITPTHSLDYSYRVVCAQNFYGSKCERECIPRNDSFGHYRCNNQGERVCLEGWRGDWCTQAQCPEGCVHGTCIAPNKCSCDTGYGGTACDECDLYEGCDHGTCNAPGECNCLPGWGGLLCDTDLNYCTNNQPCQNGATCRNERPLGFRCYCKPGFTGTHCETAEACPCRNGGTCRNGPNGNTCLCPAGYTGETCDDPVPRCDVQRCMNGGTCQDANDGYRCTCPAGYSGIHCEIFNHCFNSPCQNGATCINNNVGYQCKCPDGFRGDQCQEDLCAAHGCENGGTCRAESDSVHCDCPLGYNGDHCQNNINDCLAKPCKNGGTCIDLLNDYRCECAYGFGGRNCSDHFRPCDGDNPCENGGSCLQDVMGGFRCECTEGWRGTTCSVSLVDQQTPKPSTELQQPSRGTKSPSTNFGLSDTTQLVIYVAFGFLVISLVIILIIVVYRKQHHPEPRQKDLESNTTSTPNNRNKLTYKDNFSQEEKVLPLLSISEKVCNKEQDTFSKANTASQHKTNHHKDYPIKDFEGPPSMNQLMVIPTSSASMHNMPQARHSYPRHDSEGYYYYEENPVQLKRTDSLQTPSQTSSSQSTPRHSGNYPVLPISAVVEDRGLTPQKPVTLHATEV